MEQVKNAESIVICEVKFRNIMFPKNKILKSGDWGIVGAEVINVFEGEPKVHPQYQTITVKGTFPSYGANEIYKLVGKEVYSEQYDSYSYEILYLGKPVELKGKKEQEIFLSHILTDNQLKSLFQAYENPFKIIETEDVDKLTKAKGIGVKTAYKIIEKYKEAIDLSAIYVELNDYGLTPKMVEKLVDRYKSPQLVVENIKKNPYLLITDIDGVGWKKADEIAMNSGMREDSPFRIEAFIIHRLEELAYEGYSYVDPWGLMEEIEMNLGYIDMSILQETIQQMYSKKVLWNNRTVKYKGKYITERELSELRSKLKSNSTSVNLDSLEVGQTTKVALMKYYILELKVSQELKRLSKATNPFKFDKWKDILNKVEEKQGWKFTDEQTGAIEEALKNQVIMITGGAGTGKTSVVNGIISILEEYSYAQCALSGKASARMTEATGKESCTIHRLLGYNPSGGFIFDSEAKMPHEIIIVDEVSMIGGQLFYDLIQAVKDGSKLILLGDIHQLESIGCMNLAKDILDSKTIASVELTKIHRQAQKSGIISESYRVRHAEALYERKWAGHEIRGELKDFELDVYKDKEMSIEKVTHYFKEYLHLAKDITEIQVLVPIKDRGGACVNKLNMELQKIYNPPHPSKQELIMRFDKDKDKDKDTSFIIRENDKIMIIKNNYKVLNENGKPSPIFNGQQGMVKKIDLESGLIYLSIPLVCKELIVLPKKFWGYIMLGYASTIAKSQGSQFEYVIGCIDYSTPPTMLTKELVYTLLTRASKYCVLCGESNALYKCMTTSFVSTKQTFLKSLLDDEKL